MDFGKKILLKHGWSEGNSLGKNNSGIVQPIKANFKFDNSGFGSAAQKSEAGNHWWERVFNEASNNLQVENGQKISTLCEDGVELTNKTYSMKKIKENHGEMTYGSFLKSSTLLANVGEEVEIPGHITTDDIEIKMIPEISDEALFTACEGRTAHKGARHGLSLSGKLARLEEQDRILLEKLKNNGSKVGIFKGESKSENDEDGFTVVKSKKKKKQKNQDKMEAEGNQSDQISQVYIKKSKKKEKRDKKMEKELIEGLESKLEVMDEDQKELDLNKIPTQPDKKKRKKKRSSEEEFDSVPQDPGKYRDPASEEPPKKKKKKKNIDDDTVEQHLSKKQLKREERRKRLLQMDLEVEENPKKKKKIETSESSSPDVLLKLNPPHRKKWKKSKMEKVEQKEDTSMEEKSEPQIKKENINWKGRAYIADLSNKLEAAARFEDSQSVDTSPSS